MSGNSGIVVDKGYSATLVDNIKFALKANIETSFASTLGQVSDIVNIMASQIHFESHYNVDARGIQVSYNRGTTGYSYLNSSAVSYLLQTGTPTQKANIFEGLRGWGLGQVMGWNFVRGGGPSGKCEIENSRPDLAGALCINPGDSIAAHASGVNNISTMVLAQLVLVESKYKNVQAVGGGFMSKGDAYKRVFPTKIEAAVAAYLGLGAADGNRTTPQAYAASICYGTSYKIANGSSVSVKQSVTQVAGSGPTTNGSSKTVITPPGC